MTKLQKFDTILNDLHMAIGVEAMEGDHYELIEEHDEGYEELAEHFENGGYFAPHEVQPYGDIDPHSGEETLTGFIKWLHWD